ncbi:MAG: hypothetical protein Q9191_005406 [Dirinaria sp. TL-2023a]
MAPSNTSRLSALRTYVSTIFNVSDTISDSSHSQNIDLSKLAGCSDNAYLPSIGYVYDPLPALPLHIQRGPFSLPSGATAKSPFLLDNSVELHPLAAGLPYRSSLYHVYASKFYEQNLSEAVTLLKLLASDTSARDIELNHGVTLSQLAKKALQRGQEHHMALAAHYMFPCANRQRIKMISALMIILFVFDGASRVCFDRYVPLIRPLDKFEAIPNEELKAFRDNLLPCLDGNLSPDPQPNSFQSHMNEILQCIELEDLAGGDGGKEMLHGLRDAFHHVRPARVFQSVDEYLHFRRINVGAAFMIAAAKFSVESSVCVNDARFQRYLSLIADHGILANDLASYDKELQALENGGGIMINIVDVLKNVTSLRATDDAKRVAWSLQLQVEEDMMVQIKSLQSQGLSNEDWWFLEAVGLAAVGNVMFCMTTSRYGGEAARIKSQ